VVSAAGGILIDPTAVDLGVLRGRFGGHPIPSDEAATVGREVLELARSLGSEDTALCLVSGGGSAMLELPAPGVTVEDITVRTRELLGAGVEIAEINAVRRSMSMLKGGKLAEEMAPARVVTVVLSDVLPHGPEVVASGPTIGSTTLVRVAADGRVAARAAAEAGRIAGCRVELWDKPVRGDARGLGRRLVRDSRAHGHLLVAFGEPSVTVIGGGRGGRCRELALSALPGIAGVLLAAGTDGVDGHPSGAGAIVDPAVARAVVAAGLDVGEALSENDSGTFFDRIESTVITGPTGTNVADLFLYLTAS
jgi:hydroxypyruvate reductase